MRNCKQFYTESDSRIGSWQGGALNLDQVKLPPKAYGVPEERFVLWGRPLQPNLKRLGDAGGAKFSGCPTMPEPILESRAVYTPPAPYDVSLYMTELVDWLRNEKEIPSVLVAGIAQFQLVHIHPFLDGNGRTARLLSTLCLYQSGYDFKRLFTISEYYDRNRQDYYSALQSVRNKNMDMTDWLEYFATALETQMHEIQLKGSYAMRIDVLALQHKLSERQKSLLESLLEKEGSFTIQECESLFPSVNRRSLQRDLADLIEKGLIFQEGIKKATRYKIKRSLQA